MAFDRHIVMMSLVPLRLLQTHMVKQEPSMVVKSKGLLSLADWDLNVGFITTLDNLPYSAPSVKYGFARSLLGAGCQPQ